MKKPKYPSNYEIREILSHITNRLFLDQFARDRGVFISNVSQEELASELANLFYDDEDLEKIRSQAYDIVHSHSLTGFIVDAKSESFDLSVAYESIRLNHELERGIILQPLRKISKRDEAPIYRGSMEYTKKKPGKMEFLEEGKFSFDFYVNKVKSGQWKVEVDCSKSSDIKEIKKIFNKHLPVEDHIIDSIQEDLLSVENSIQFFDELCNNGLNQDWRFLQVEHVAVRKDMVAKKTPEQDEEQLTEEEVSVNRDVNDALTGINKAILEGKDIREDEFIKGCENKGFRFTAMTYQFEHISQPYIISLIAEFSGRPRVFEIEVKQVTETTGSNASRILGALNIEENRLVRSQFWNNAKIIYDKLKTFRLVKQF